jgi:acetylornithine/succinyldiaminopimelate/putrescine aminotransferase
MADNSLTILHHLRDVSGEPETVGLTDEIITRFCATDAQLVQAINEASTAHQALIEEFGMDVMALPESELIPHLQEDYVNFYAPATVNPYIPIAGRGPWLVTSSGAVLHDNGGYGMLGSGHGPDSIIKAMSQNWIMANIMTPSFSQKRLGERLRKELGHTRGYCPFDRFICMNSGSESVTVSLRIADVNAKSMTDPGGRHEGKPIKLLAVERAFHGRTGRPAQISHSCMSKYKKNLASFRDMDNLLLVPANDIPALQAMFKRADDEGFFIEMMALEPVQGEGSPGRCVDRAFYDEARRLTNEHGSMLMVDSVQAGLRGQGCLSVVDYQGFEDAEAPDLEAWSKALNAGQYPLSVLGMNKRASELYVVGIYGNTMTTNPRALETAVAVLDHITPELRDNIRDRGAEMVEKLKALQEQYPTEILEVQGTGLLVCAELDPERFQVVGFDMVEVWCRKHGLGVIHGGVNALRYTPNFNITSEEVDLVVDLTRQAIEAFL